MTSTLAERAEDLARVALANIEREFPHHEPLLQTSPEPPPRPRELHPAFYGSLDWHSCVEMHWLLARLLRAVPEHVPAAEIRKVLDAHLSADALAAEADFFAQPDQSAAERPYGWAWAFMLAADLLEAREDPDATRWASNLEPLVELLVERLVAWLPKLTYPVRSGTHTNTAFALSLSLPLARLRSDSTLLDAVTDAARRWYVDDADYAARWEPSGLDFLSPALTEAELVASLLPRAELASWLECFLPGIAGGEPASLFTPAVVSDPTDGHIAHLHGLNLSRAWCWRRLADTLPDGDPRVPVALRAADGHAAASIDQAVGSDYMLKHWLAAYAVLYLSG